MKKTLKLLFLTKKNPQLQTVIGDFEYYIILSNKLENIILNRNDQHSLL